MNSEEEEEEKEKEAVSIYLFYDVAGDPADDFIEVRRVERFVWQPETHVVHALRILTHSLTNQSIAVNNNKNKMMLDEIEMLLWIGSSYPVWLLRIEKGNRNHWTRRVGCPGFRTAALQCAPVPNRMPIRLYLVLQLKVY